ncbi:hypothetical protein JTE90_015553 [Oedothorax gibbosus]|uniref:Uncharacterized protein n=1 Tax=Oedothorax gibbosus TaxID=931172 RepID=A0AAV6TV50_9ARAC|nr:hypothetical protein JTE90_015553 [Oedothorax gibbosus]
MNNSKLYAKCHLDMGLLSKRLPASHGKTFFAPFLAEIGPIFQSSYALAKGLVFSLHFVSSDCVPISVFEWPCWQRRGAQRAPRPTVPLMSPALPRHNSPLVKRRHFSPSSSSQVRGAFICLVRNSEKNDLVKSSQVPAPEKHLQI